MNTTIPRLRWWKLALVVGGVACAPRAGDAVDEIDASRMRSFASDSALYEIRDVAVGERGEVWVLSALEPYLYRYDARGRLLGRFGRQGKGPGELLNPWSLMPVPGGVGVWDVSSRRLLTYASDGRFVAGRDLPVRGGTVRGDIREVSYGQPFQLRPTPGGVVVQVPVGSVSQTADLYRSILLRVANGGAAADTIADFMTLRPGSVRGGPRALVPIPLWAACANGRVAVLDPVGSTVRWYAGEELTPAGSEHLDIPVEAIGDQDLRRHLAHLLALETRGSPLSPADAERTVDQMLAGAGDQFGREAPGAVDLLCDVEGKLWLNRFSTADHPLGYGREWMVFAREKRERVVRFPAGFRPVQLLEGRALGTFTDADGVQHAAVVSLGAE